jgi:ubiquitin-associated SH3 domain-containing protein
MKEAGIKYSHAYCSPSFRCVETCTNILRELNLTNKVQINIEPGLFEWLAWYQEAAPQWMTPSQLAENGYHINLEYKPLLGVNELLSKKTETCEEFYTRSTFVSNSILNSTSGHILLLGHASSLDTCTRQVIGKKPRSAEELVHMVNKIPYCGVSVMEEVADKQWALVKPPILTLQHSVNPRYDWKMLRTDKEDTA